MKKIVKSFVLCFMLALSANASSSTLPQEHIVEEFATTTEPCKITVTVKVSVGVTSMSIGVSQTAETCEEATKAAAAAAMLLVASFSAFH